MFFLNAFSQKPNIKSHKIKINTNCQEYLKKINTFSYEIQDDGAFWNYIPGEDDNYQFEIFPNINSLTEGVKIDGLTQTLENADLKIVVGFIGNHPKIEKGIVSMEGTASIFLLLNDNKILSHKIIDIKPSNLPGKKYPMRTRTERIQTKANLLSIAVQNELNELKYLFNDQLELNLAFGMFKKVKKGNALLFNQKSETLINSILKDSSNKQTLNEAETYWLSQLKSDFGKKVKTKSINKVIYSNLLSVAILQYDNNKMKKYMDVLKENVGLFDGWFARLKAGYKVIEALKNLKSLEELPTTTVTPEMVYKITINEKGFLKRKKKEIEFSIQKK